MADGQWYTDAILWASNAGIVTGYSDTGKFGPADPINREQIAVMMYRYAQYLGYDTKKQQKLYIFHDGGNVNSFAIEDKPHYHIDQLNYHIYIEEYKILMGIHLHHIQQIA